MARFTDNLHTMIGRVRDIRPSLGQEQYRTLINDSIREVINKRTYWVDLRQTGVVSVPSAVLAGTVSLATGSNQVTGAGTAWPVADVINTTLAEGMNDVGFEQISLTSSAGLTDDSILLIDAGSPSQEFIAVRPIPGGGYAGNFAFPHAAGVTVTQSSLVQRQFRAGFQHPIFTVMAVVDAQTIILDMPWGGLPLNNVAYKIAGMYFTIFSNIRQILAVVDQQQGIPLSCTMTQQELNVMDPQRTDNSDPLALVSNKPNANKNMTWEIYPSPLTGRQLTILATLQWPELQSPDDIPPPFLEPTIFTDLAASKALRRRMSKDDPFFDMNLAREFERTYKEAVQDAIDSEEAIAIQDYKQQLTAMTPGMGSDFWLRHAPEQLAWQF